MSPQDEFAAAHVQHFQSFASVLRMSRCIGIKCFLFLVYYTWKRIFNAPFIVKNGNHICAVYLLGFAIFVTEGCIAIIIVSGNIVSQPDNTTFLCLRRKIRYDPGVVHRFGTINISEVIWTRFGGYATLEFRGSYQAGFLGFVAPYLNFDSLNIFGHVWNPPDKRNVHGRCLFTASLVCVLILLINEAVELHPDMAISLALTRIVVLWVVFETRVVCILL